MNKTKNDIYTEVALVKNDVKWIKDKIVDFMTETEKKNGEQDTRINSNEKRLNAMENNWARLAGISAAISTIITVVIGLGFKLF